MLIHSEFILIGIVTGIFAIYTICWMVYNIVWDKNASSIIEAENIMLLGGSKFVRNIFFLAIAASQLYSPCVLCEVQYTDRTTLLVLVISRLLVIIIGTIFWNHLSSLGFRSVDEYLRKRFDSSVLAVAYKANIFLSWYYFWTVHIIFSDGSRVHYFKALLAASYLMATLSTLASIGGLHLTLIACCLLWVVEIAGQFLLFSEFYPFAFRDYAQEKIDIDPCYSLLGGNCFFVALSQLLSVQPMYNIFHAANSITEANIAIGLSVILYILNVVLSCINASGMLHFQNIDNASLSVWASTLLTQPYHGLSTGVADVAASNTRGYLLSHTVEGIHIASVLIILGPYSSNSIACLLLQVQQFACVTYTRIFPNWLRMGLVSDGREFQITYASLSILIAYVSAVLLVYIPLNTSNYQSSTFHIYPPFTTNVLLYPVACAIFLAPILADLWSLPAVISLIIFVSLGLAYRLQTDPYEAESGGRFVERCIASWIPTGTFIAAIITIIILSLLLRPPRYLSQSLVYKWHITMRRKGGKSHTPSVQMEKLSKAEK